LEIASASWMPDARSGWLTWIWMISLFGTDRCGGVLDQVVDRHARAVGHRLQHVPAGDEHVCVVSVRSALSSPELLAPS